jgi:hypothetical protein
MCKREGESAKVCDYKKDANRMSEIVTNRLASNISSCLAERVVLGHALSDTLDSGPARALDDRLELS